LSEKEDVLMATKPNFDVSLQLPDEAALSAAKRAGEELPGPVARGPMGPGDKIHWIYVWVIQNREGRSRTSAAAAYGQYPEEEHSESSQKRTKESRPLVGKSWKVPTEMAHPGDKFAAGPAIATSMALIEREDKSREVYWWTEAVELMKPRARRR
jgi:hypothetical protein